MKYLQRITIRGKSYHESWALPYPEPGSCLKNRYLPGLLCITRALGEMLYLDIDPCLAIGLHRQARDRKHRVLSHPLSLSLSLSLSLFILCFLYFNALIKMMLLDFFYNLPTYTLLYNFIPIYILHQYRQCWSWFKKLDKAVQLLKIIEILRSWL